MMKVKSKGHIDIVIDRRSSESIEDQIVFQIRNLILRHQDDSILTDVEKLSVLLDVPRDIIIRAFNRLIDERFYSIDHQGKYYISYHEMVWITDESLYSIADVIRSLGQELTIECTQRKEITSDQHTQQETGFPVGTRLFYQERIYYGDRHAKGVFKVYFHADTFSDANSDENSIRPYYDFISYNFFTTPVKREFQVITLPQDINYILNQRKNTAGFKIVEMIFNQSMMQTVYAIGYANSNYLLKYKNKFRQM